MKVPIALNELGLVQEGVEGNYCFFRNGDIVYEQGFEKGRVITFKEYKTLYPIEVGHIFYRRRRS